KETTTPEASQLFRDATMCFSFSITFIKTRKNKKGSTNQPLKIPRLVLRSNELSVEIITPKNNRKIPIDNILFFRNIVPKLRSWAPEKYAQKLSFLISSKQILPYPRVWKYFDILNLFRTQIKNKI
ncbi:hypothetical protein KAI52_03130, partial [Candidatus Parcubacteria bacterium]|nr:hypothetical protein [Candidatus Parcubacteria bacterium]